MAELAGHLDVLDLVGHDTVLWERDPKTGYMITTAFASLATSLERPRLLVVDGVSDTFGSNENAQTEVKRYVNALLPLGHIAKLTAANADTSEGYFRLHRNGITWCAPAGIRKPRRATRTRSDPSGNCCSSCRSAKSG
jgi:hypothetical protein